MAGQPAEGQGRAQCDAWGRVLSPHHRVHVVARHVQAWYGLPIGAQDAFAVFGAAVIVFVAVNPLLYVRPTERIVQLLAQAQTVSVAELAEQLNVSGWTVRRDLNALEARGLLERRYGEAQLRASLASLTTPADLELAEALAAVCDARC